MTEQTMQHQRLDEMRASMVKVWLLSAKSPLPASWNKPRQRSTVLIGGPVFWVVVFLARITLYSLVLFYAIMVIAVKLALALLVTLMYLFARAIVAVGDFRRRRSPAA